jgi:hypothetical protein
MKIVQSKKGQKESGCSERQARRKTAYVQLDSPCILIKNNGKIFKSTICYFYLQEINGDKTEAGRFWWSLCLKVGMV